MSDAAVNIPIEKLVAPRIVLRLVERDSVEYMEMLESIRALGLINSLCVRPHPDQPGMYEVVTGAHRLACFHDLGRKTVPCIVKELSDDEVLLLQIEENAIRVETQPADFALHLHRLLKSNAGITIAKLSKLVDKSPTWIRQMLRITDLAPAAKKAVQRGEITLANAIVLARLVPPLRANYLDQARTMTQAEFNRLIAGVVKQFREDIKLGKMQQFYAAEFKPQPFFHPLRVVVQEIEVKHDDVDEQPDEQL
jgi:ParB/RepB/Spo0J family partition protein